MLKLQAKPRNVLGKRVKALRRAGFLPAVVYGEGVKSEPLSVSYKDFEKAHREAGESTLLALEVDGKIYNVLIHDIKYDPVKNKLLHADFYAVRMDKVLQAKVPLEFFGESLAVKSEGGVLVKVLHELEVEALPQNLPRELRVDLTSLASIGSRLLAKDILLPAEVKVLAESDEVLAIVEAPRSEEELAKLEEVAPAAEAPAEVKTEREVKSELKAKSEEESAEPQTKE